MNTFTFEKDYTANKIIITCKFNAPLNIVWDAFTNPATLEKWFAPEPYKAITKTSDFRKGGHWLYYMLSPKGEKFWSITRYKNIETNKLLEVSDGFCDENGNINENLPQLNWIHNFSEQDNITTVDITISFANEKDMKKILEMGFEEGYKTGLRQLQEIIKKK